MSKKGHFKQLIIFDRDQLSLDRNFNRIKIPGRVNYFVMWQKRHRSWSKVTVWLLLPYLPIKLLWFEILYWKQVISSYNLYLRDLLESFLFVSARESGWNFVLSLVSWKATLWEDHFMAALEFKHTLFHLLLLILQRKQTHKWRFSQISEFLLSFCVSFLQETHFLRVC